MPKDINFGAGITVSAIVGGTASVIGGGKFGNGASTGAFVYALNDSANELLGEDIEKRQSDLYERLLNDARTSSFGVLDLSGRDIVNIMEFERLRADSSTWIQPFRYFQDFYLNADTILFDPELVSRNLRVAGVGTFKGGDISYIGLGVMAAHYGHSSTTLRIAIARWNDVQWGIGKGDHNLQQKVTGNFWAQVGYNYYIGRQK